MTAKKKAPQKSLRTAPEQGVLFGLPLAVLLAASGGLMILLSFPRFDLFWLAWFGPACIVLSLWGRRPGQAFLLGLVAGFIGNMGGFYWMSNMLQDFAHMSVGLSWVITCLLIAYQGVYYALAAALSAGVIRRWPKVPWLLVFPAAYTAFEFVYPLIFPWYAANGQQLFYAAIQIADLFGAPGISFLLMFVGTAIAGVIAARMERRPFPVAATVTAAVLLSASLVYGVLRIHEVDARAAAAPKFRVALVEADVGIWEKEAKHADGSKMTGEEKGELLFSNLLKHQYLSELVEKKYHPDLIVWPETSYLPLKNVYVKRRGGRPAAPGQDDGLPAGITDRSFIRAWPFPTDAEKVYVSKAPLPAAGSYRKPVPGYLADSKTPLEDRNAAMRGFSTPLLFGAASQQPETPEGARPVKYNTAVMIDGAGDVLGMYRKTMLLVFGEYLPFERQFPFLRKWLPEAGVWTEGDGPRVFDLGKARIGVSICYEDLMAPFNRRMSALNPNLLVNITNDAWFGKTREPWLHLQLAELRSVETRMFMARATNTGISAFTDPVGRRMAHTSMENPEYLVADLGLTAEKTVYLRIGDAFAWACCCLTGIMGVFWAVGAAGNRRKGNPA